MIDLYELVTKLNGPISPIGDAAIDEKRFENLKSLCELVNKLIVNIDDVGMSSDHHLASVAKAKEYANQFMTKTLGIVE